MSGGRPELDPTERLLVRLSRVRPAPAIAAADLTGVDLERLLAHASRHANYDLVGWRLLELGDALPLAPRLRLERHLNYLAVRVKLLLADLGELAESLAADGEPLVLLKGGAYTRYIYPERGRRSFADVDVLLRPGAVAAAVAALGRRGYQVVRTIEGSLDLLRSVGRPAIRLPVELTTRLVHTHEYPYYRAELKLSEERLLERAESRDLDGHPVKVLCAADELLYSIIHFFFHHDLEGLKYHSDLSALLTDPVRPLDVEAAVRTARLARAEHVVGLVLRAHQATFGPGAVPAELLERLAPSGIRWRALAAVLPPLHRLPLVVGRVATHPVKILAAPGVFGPAGLALRWLFPGKRFLMTFYRLEPASWRLTYHLRYPVAILRKGLHRALLGWRHA